MGYVHGESNPQSLTPPNNDAIMGGVSLRSSKEEQRTSNPFVAGSSPVGGAQKNSVKELVFQPILW